MKELLSDMKIPSKQTGTPSAQIVPRSELTYLAVSNAVPPSIQQSSSTFPIRKILLWMSIVLAE